MKSFETGIEFGNLKIRGALSITIVNEQMENSKKIISTEKAPAAIGPYSQAVECNNMLFISGQIPVAPETGEIISNRIEDQTKQVLENMRAILEKAGYTFESIVKTTVFLTDMELFASMNEVYATYFTENQPARSTISVKALPKGVSVEIEAIAMK